MEEGGNKLEGGGQMKLEERGEGLWWRQEGYRKRRRIILGWHSR